MFQWKLSISYDTKVTSIVPNLGGGIEVVIDILAAFQH